MPQSIHLLKIPAAQAADIHIVDAVAAVVVPEGNMAAALAEVAPQLPTAAVPVLEVALVLVAEVPAPVVQMVPVPAVVPVPVAELPVQVVPVVAVRCRELPFRIVYRNFLLLLGCRNWYKTSIKLLSLITL